MGPENGHLVNPNVVQSTAERLARRDLLRRGGKVAFAVTMANWLLGAAPAHAEEELPIGPDHNPGNCPLCNPSLHCEQIGFGCDCIDKTCKRNGATCTPRYECPSGGYCWTECCNGSKLSSCDWWCAGYRCHCTVSIGSCGSNCCPCA